jgi:nucleotide-binding universal stress UspA family protein
MGLRDEDIHGAVLDSRTGTPAEVILAAVQQLRRPMIVMCTSTEDDAGPDCFGPVMEAVLGATPTRIVLVGPECDHDRWTLRRVLLAHDGTPSSDLATAPAAELAQRAGAEVIALHVAAGGERYRKQPRSLPSPQYIDQPQHEWPAWANEFLNRMLAVGAPLSSVSFKLVVTGGQPGSEVAEVSRERDADIVVMAWHGRWNAPQSPTKVVLRTAGCPVLLVYSAAE